LIAWGRVTFVDCAVRFVDSALGSCWEIWIPILLMMAIITGLVRENIYRLRLVIIEYELHGTEG